MSVQSPPSAQVIHPNALYRRAKRIMDVAFTLLLLPGLGPALLIVALLVRLDSRGPIFFRQRRLGQDGVEFECIKFRSMYADADETVHRTTIERFMSGQELNRDAVGVNPYKLGADPRITRVGRFIRKTSLDELPQFWQVLRGEMSLVGPRPPLPYEAERYSSRARLRLAGKPGLTGIWQVYGRSRVSFAEMVEMDITYLQQQSLLQDLKLIFLTLPVMLSGRGGA